MDNKTNLLFEHLFLRLDEDDSSLGRTYCENINKGSDGVPDPVGKLFKAAADRQITRSDWDWNSPLSASRIELSQDFLERSDARLARVTETIRKIFGEHTEEAEEAIAIAKDMRDAVREEVLGRHAA